VKNARQAVGNGLARSVDGRAKFWGQDGANTKQQFHSAIFAG